MWKPVITDAEDILRINKKIEEIANLLSLTDPEKEEPSLLGGAVGVAIFLTYYGRLKKREDHLNLSGELISHAINKLNNSNSLPFTFAVGIPGIFWGIQHLIQEGFIGEEAEELFKETDELVCNEMIRQIKTGNFDYLHGGLGLMLYLLQRNKNEHFGELEKAFKALTDTAILNEEKETAKWVSLVDKEHKPSKVYNLSLSHGISSIINISARYLSRAKNAAVYKRDKQLITFAINYLKQQENAADAVFCFPSYISQETNEKAQGSRIAWCYGDLGISIALYSSGCFLNDQYLKKYSLDLLEQYHKKNAYKLTGVVDGALCHGTTGIAHIYQRLYNYTGDEQFKKMAAYYYRETLNMASHADGLAGYKAPGPHGYRNTTGLLEGIAGIGLSLISAISDTEPKWDECLLLS